jgi:hypothetical protein
MYYKNREVGKLYNLYHNTPQDKYFIKTIAPSPINIHGYRIDKNNNAIDYKDNIYQLKLPTDGDILAINEQMIDTPPNVMPTNNKGLSVFYLTSSGSLEMYKYEFPDMMDIASDSSYRIDPLKIDRVGIWSDVIEIAGDLMSIMFILHKDGKLSYHINLKGIEPMIRKSQDSFIQIKSSAGGLQTWGINKNNQVIDLMFGYYIDINDALKLVYLSENCCAYIDIRGRLKLVVLENGYDTISITSNEEYKIKDQLMIRDAVIRADRASIEDIMILDVVGGLSNTSERKNRSIDKYGLGVFIDDLIVVYLVKA